MIIWQKRCYTRERKWYFQKIPHSLFWNIKHYNSKALNAPKGSIFALSMNSSAIDLGLKFAFPFEVTKKCSVATSSPPSSSRWNALVTVLGDFRWKVGLTLRWYTRIAFTTHRSTRCSTRIVFPKTNSIHSSRFTHLFSCLIFKVFILISTIYTSAFYLWNREIIKYLRALC